MPLGGTGAGASARQDRNKNYHFDGLRRPRRRSTAAWPGRAACAHLPAASTPGATPGRPKRHAGKRAHACTAPGQASGRVVRASRTARRGAQGFTLRSHAHPSAPWPRPSTAIARSCKAPRAHGLEDRDIHRGREGVHQSLRNAAIPGSNEPSDADVSPIRTRPATKRAALRAGRCGGSVLRTGARDERWKRARKELAWHASTDPPNNIAHPDGSRGPGGSLAPSPARAPSSC